MSIYPIKKYIHHKKEIFSLLSQLASATEIDDEQFNNIILNLKDNHNIYLYIKKDKVVGMITLLFEQKLIHNGGIIAHIEDLVVDEKYSGQGIASELINYCLTQIDRDNCYKIILDCKRELIPFYKKFGFENKNVQMSKYF